MEQEIGKIKSARLGYEDHGIFTAEIVIDGGGWGQALPSYFIRGEHGIEYLEALMKAVGVNYFDQLVGKTIFILRDEKGGPAVGIQNLPTERGGVLVFKEFWDQFEVVGVGKAGTE